VGRPLAVAVEPASGPEVVGEGVEDQGEREVVGVCAPGFSLVRVGEAVGLPRDRQPDLVLDVGADDLVASHTVHRPSPSKCRRMPGRTRPSARSSPRTRSTPWNTLSVSSTTAVLWAGAKVAAGPAAPSG